MRFMGRDRVHAVVGAILVAGVAHGAHLAYERSGIQDPERRALVERRIADVAAYPGLDALLIGGSNVIYGLSAEQLTAETDFSFYNLGMRSEAFNERNYQTFMRETLSGMRSDIQVVVYSTSHYFSKNVNDWGKDIYGEVVGLSLSPTAPLAMRLYDFVRTRAAALTGGGPRGRRGGQPYVVTPRYGDFSFDGFRCVLRPTEIGRKSIEEAGDILAPRVAWLAEFFDQATIIVVVPSVHDSIAPYSDAELAALNSRLGSDRIRIAQQSRLPEELLCDTFHHPNENGRRLRTSELTRLVRAAAAAPDQAAMSAD